MAQDATSCDRRFPHRSTGLRILLAAIVLGSIVWYFGPVLFAPRCLAFRDAAHYYHPLFQWAGRRWAAGDIPLWNPQENCGVPVLADATSSIFYPGKLLFATPLDFSLQYKLYVVGHMLLAASTTFRLARHWNASILAAGLCALSYAFGGNVLFQYCNVVYLVGAAWLPAALLAADRMLVDRRLRSALMLGMILALMVLGGDPQMAYNAGLLVTLYALLLWVGEKRNRKCQQPVTEWHRIESAATGDEETFEVEHGQDARGTPSHGPAEKGDWLHNRLYPPSSQTTTGCGACPLFQQSHGHDAGGTRSRIARAMGQHRLALLAVAALTALVLSAIQVFPSSQWTGRCQRASFQNPRSVWEIPAHLAREGNIEKGGAVARGLFAAPASGTHHEHIYHFSVGPWRLAEFIWPNFSGKMFPINRRWTNAIPAEGRIWTPSLYAGLLPLVLGLSAWRLRGGNHQVRWASWMLLLATIGAFGWYGVGWLLQEVRVGILGCEVDDLLIGQPVGGLYWLMVVLLPGYALFRFPAKLMVIAALGLALLAARGFDRLNEREPRRLRWCLLGVITISLILLLISLAAGTSWERWTGSAPSDTLFGPYDSAGALADLRLSLLQVVLVGGFVWWLLTLGARQNRLWIAPALLLITAADLALAHGWMVLSAPQNLWQKPGVAETEIMLHRQSTERDQPVRVRRGVRASWWPEDWTETSAEDRHARGIRWDRDTLSPKYPLLGELEMVESFGSCTSADYLAFLRVARRFGPRRPDKAAELHPRIVDLLGAKYLVLPADFDYADTQHLPSHSDRPLPKNASLWVNPRAYPRAWIVHDVTTLPALHTDGPIAVDRRTCQVLFPGGQPRDFRTTAVVEIDGRIDFSSGGASDALGAPNERCRVVNHAAERVEIEATLRRPGLLVVSDTYYPGWIAKVYTAGRPAVNVPILQTNRVMRGIVLPAGEHRIVLLYRPALLYAGAGVSVLGWLALLIVLALGTWHAFSGCHW